MIRRPPRSTQSRSSAASDVYKRQVLHLRRDGALRYVAELALVRREGNGTLTMTTALRADACGVVESGPGWATLASRLGLLALELPRPVVLDGVGALAVAAR